MTFQVGDIVEVNFSVVVMPVKQEKHQMMLVLRGLALLDSSLTTVRQINLVLHPYELTPISACPHQTHQQNCILIPPAGVSSRSQEEDLL